MSKQHRHKITHQQIASHQLVNGYFKNIPFTLAYEHHLWICHQLNSSQQKEIFYTNLMRLKDRLLLTLATLAIFKIFISSYIAGSW